MAMTACGPADVEAAKAGIRAHYAQAVASGWCIQCTFPWYDGMCECAPHDGLARFDSHRIYEMALRVHPRLGRELYLLTCELQGEVPVPLPEVLPGEPLPVLDRTPEELRALWTFADGATS